MPTLKEIADHLGGTLEGPGDLEIKGLRPLDSAGPDEIVFVHDERHAARLKNCEVAAVICQADLDVGGLPAIRVPNARAAAAAVLAWLHPEPRPAPGRHPTASVADEAVVPDSCSLAAFAVVEAGAELGQDVVLGAHTVVGPCARIGEGTRLDANVTIYAGVEIGRRCVVHSGAVIGAPGFGYEPTPDGIVAFPQIGRVVIGDDVRIGANTCVDRSAFDVTRIGNGSKIDNIVQIGHNATIGEDVMVCGQAGMAGGSVLEDRTILGPQGALANGAVLGAGTILGARGALISNQTLADPGAVYVDGPAMAYRDWRRFQAWVFSGKWRKMR